MARGTAPRSTRTVRSAPPRAAAPQPQPSRIVRREIGSWGEFVNIVQRWKGFRNWCFRGQGSAEWSLRSSLARHIEVSKVNPGA